MPHNEIVPYTEGVIQPCFLFPLILDNIQNDLPVSMLSAEQHGTDAHYVLRTPESCRLLSIIEQRQSHESVQWFAQTFCVKLEELEDGKTVALPSYINRQMAMESARSPRDIEGIYQLISKLRFGYGTGSELKYLRGYDDEPHIGWADGFKVSFEKPEYATEDYPAFDNPISVVEDSLVAAGEEEVSTLVYDIAKHMTELGRVIEMSQGSMHVYRTRLDNYPLVPDTVADLVLVYCPGTDTWYRGSTFRQKEISKAELLLLCDYANLIIPLEIPAFIYGGIRTKLGDVDASEQALAG